MSEGYRTEEEQVEALKNWWKDNGKSTVASIVIAIAVVFGWQGWQKHQLSQKEAASAAYQELLLAIDSADDKQTAKHLAATLREEHAGSSYAQFAALYQAQFAVEEEDLVAAEQHLQWIVANPVSEELELQARLRLARLKYAQAAYVDAMALLAVDAKAYAGAYEEVKGDVLNAQGNKAQALEAYLKAQSLAQTQTGSAPNPILMIKLQHLQSQLGSTEEEK